MSRLFKYLKNLLTLASLLLFYIPLQSQSDPKMMIIVIDGARYTETFGDPTYTWIPRMAHLSAEGTVVNDFRNDGVTYTSRAIPALWSGAWTQVRDTVYQGKSTQYSVKPSIFEYFRKHKQQPAGHCYYVLKYISGLWLPSFDQDYGPAYWPTLYSQGSNDEAVCSNTKTLMSTDQPDFIWVYLADVDHAGHSGDWDYYTSTLRKADSIVGVLWYHAQSLSYYQDNLTMIVTNDHGRHDDQHGGFQNHGCGCEGCRRIQFLAVGPGIHKNFVSTQPRVLPDMAVTAAHILGFEMEKATGQVMSEILGTSSTGDHMRNNQPIGMQVIPNPFSETAKVHLSVTRPLAATLLLYDLTGKAIITTDLGLLEAGLHTVLLNGGTTNKEQIEAGVYIILIKTEDKVVTGKVVVY
jgi:hypothetical protein